MGYTEQFGFSTVGPGEDIFADGYKFTSADRVLLDSLLYLALSGHVHDGSSVAESNPTLPLSLALETTGGTIPSGVRLYYTYTLVDQTSGIETIAAPEIFIDTPDPIDRPDRPSLVFQSTGGTLLPGQYVYALTAWTDFNTNETNASPAATITIPALTGTNEITVAFPTLPDGAQGFNVYRRKPGGRNYDFLASVDVVATSDTEYVDDGSVTEDCNRIAPTRNTTNSTNSIEVSFPGATPTVPDGFTWRIYRSTSSGNYAGSLLHWVVEETSEGSGIISPTHLDAGSGTFAGQPPTNSATYGNPDPIILTDGAHVQGALPTGMVGGYVDCARFSFPGEVEVQDGTFQWECVTPSARVLAVKLRLGLDSTPSATSVEAQVVKHTGASDIDMFPSGQPSVPVGQNAGSWVVPTAALANTLMTRGDTLTVNITQSGAGATPNDYDLVVMVYVVLYGFDVSTTFDPNNEDAYDLF